MTKLIDITGKKYNRLTVVKKHGTAPGGAAIWECKCECGATTYVRGSNLKSGAVKSCGCLKNVPPNKTHGRSNEHIYGIWRGIKSRCYNEKIPPYKNYGGRGIKMCSEWRDSSNAFITWALEHGYKDGLSIERVDNNGDYTPENCIWIQKGSQAKNRRSAKEIEYGGKVQSLDEWCKELGVSYKRVHNRMRKLGWNFERAVSEPVHAEKKSKKWR